MPIYHKLGDLPAKRHTIFQSKDGAHRYEQLFGTEGFSGMSSLLYHVHRPTQVKEILRSYSVEPKIAINKNIKEACALGGSENLFNLYRTRAIKKAAVAAFFGRYR